MKTEGEKTKGTPRYSKSGKTLYGERPWTRNNRLKKKYA